MGRLVRPWADRLHQGWGPGLARRLRGQWAGRGRGHGSLTEVLIDRPAGEVRGQQSMGGPAQPRGGQRFAHRSVVEREAAYGASLCLRRFHAGPEVRGRRAEYSPLCGSARNTDSVWISLQS